MKIESYVIKNGMIRIHTDSKTMPDFTYPSDMFATKAALIKEMEKKIAEVEKRQNRTKAREDNLKAELTKNG